MKLQSLKPRQLNAIKLLAMGKPIIEVAEILQVTTMTVYRWQKQPEFSSKLNWIANSGMEELAKKMNSTALTAVETLQEILCDPTLPRPIQIKAALGVLNAMTSVNVALERGLKHRTADFDLRKRWGSAGDPAFTYDANGNEIVFNRSIESAEEVVTIC